MSNETKIVIELDLKHLTDGEIAWLHALKARVTVRSGQEYLARMKQKRAS